MKIRLIGLPAEIDQALAIIRVPGAFDVIQVDGPYPNRGGSLLVRLYIEVQLSGRYAIFDPGTGIQVSGWMSKAEADHWQPGEELAHEQHSWQIRRYDWQARAWIPVRPDSVAMP